jgi:lipoprotein NlpD
LSNKWAEKGAYVVKSGDTLYSIAWQAGMEVQQLASLNQLQAPFKIYAGQKLHFKAKNKMAASFLSELSSKPKQNTEISTASTGRKESSLISAPLSHPASLALARWNWPVKGKILQNFGQGPNKGIDISGQAGTLVRASAKGQVVYSGSGLRGYGNLVIIKHDNDFLSAYGHNRLLKVREGEEVKQGQIIAEMGHYDDSAMLHFEIRHKGKPVNPLRYLPKNQN